MSSRFLCQLCFGVLLIVGCAGLPSRTLAETDPFPLMDYRTESWFLPQSPSVTAGPVSGFFNPAAFAQTDRSGLDLWWNDDSVRSGRDNFGLAVGRTLNFSARQSTWGDRTDNFRLFDYQIGLARGDRATTFGLAYRWSHGDTDRQPRQKALAAGLISRRGGWLSVGMSGVRSLESPSAQYLFDLGIRPFARPWVTLFADWSVHDDQSFFQNGAWSAGLELRPLRGLHLGFRTREKPGSDDLDFGFSLGVTFSELHYTGLSRYDQDGDHTQTSHLVRMTPPFAGDDPPQLLPLPASRFYFALSLENKVLTYQKYRLFDDKRVAWLDLLKLLNSLQDEEDVNLVAVNIAGMRGRPSLIWELRQKLEELKVVHGKEILIHSDHLTPMTLYLASVADQVTIDPLGLVQIPGIALTRSYLKGTLEKLGLGFQEHRYFAYKSAAETLSRDSMSEADREQRGRIVDVIYETLRQGPARDRGLSNDAFDRIVDDLALLTAAEAADAGLVDRISRWDALPRLMKQDHGARPYPKRLGTLGRTFWDEQWGQPLKIPVVYAVGPCAMDSGINGRKTSEYLRKLVRDPSVVAVVLRADSPGGDPLPSDLVADAVRQLKKAGKPVIVSQGDVAASGGYWISMDGTEILTTPLTITGSIGVISGWVWDDGFAEKMGITADSVHRGRHSDLFTNVNLPFLGGIPRRPMDESELDRTRSLITGMYDDFVQAVARGRGLDSEVVAEVAQGRVWMGGDAIEHDLCDGFGTLDQAIGRARTLAGIPDWQEVAIVEYPRRPLLQFPNFGPQIPGLFGLGDRIGNWLATLAGGVSPGEFPPADPPSVLMAPGLDACQLRYLETLVTSPGQPLLAIPPDLVPRGWEEDF